LSKPKILAPIVQKKMKEEEIIDEAKIEQLNEVKRVI
jgi:hypothetical protein